MRLSEFLEAESRPRGYRVKWEWAGDGFLTGEHCPERDEPCFTSEEEAWTMAARIATTFRETTRRAVNVYVTAENWTPVPGYRERMLNRHGR